MRCPVTLISIAVGAQSGAVHAAHRLAGAFPDGQFFLPLLAHTAGQRPVDPADALASLLLTAGVPAAQIPRTLEHHRLTSVTAEFPPTAPTGQGNQAPAPATPSGSE
jgi:hypothetical protein